MNKRVEVLAPAGSFESLKAAVAAGADAVYMGGSRFGARAYADNPDNDLFLEALDYAHIHGVSVYMTVNTLVKEKELPDMYEFLLPLYERGLDAVLVQDMGVFSYIRRNFPKLPIHISTQMTVTGPESTRLMTELGASRVVLAREESLEEIRKIKRETGAEIETFVHGALCYSYSGQCLASSLIGGRSGNRGRCAQTCRLPFDVFDEKGQVNKKNERYCLSLKDLCSLDLLPDIIDAGVYSLKIEGRMKSPRYTAGVVSIYRKYVDRYLEYGREGYYVEQEDRKALLDLFDRGGQSEGYYKVHNGRDMVVRKEKPDFREENRELSLYLDNTFVNAKVKESISAYAYIHEGEPALLTYNYFNPKTDVEVCAAVTGSVVEKAQNQPMSEERIVKQLSKSGDTEFRVDSFTADVEGSVFIPVQELNELRRKGLEELRASIIGSYQRERVEENTEKPVVLDAQNSDRMTFHFSLERTDSLKSVVREMPEGSIVSLDAASWAPESWKAAAESIHTVKGMCYLVLPHIWRTEAEKWYEQCSGMLAEGIFDGFVVRAWEEIPVLKRLTAEIREKTGRNTKVLMDFNIYTMNQEAECFIRSFCGDMDVDFTWPVELNYHELMERRTVGGELFVYGALPMMVSAQCVRKTTLGCSKKPQVLMMKDRKGKEFPVENHCRFCYSTMLNSDPVSLLKESDRIAKLAPESIRLQFTTEDAQRTAEIIRAYRQVFDVSAGEEGRPSVQLTGDFTNGHFKRGVE